MLISQSAIPPKCGWLRDFVSSLPRMHVVGSSRYSLIAALQRPLDFAFPCKPYRRSAVRCACAASEWTARLSAFKTSSHSAGYLALWNPMPRNVRPAVVHFLRPQRSVFGHPPGHALAPHPKRRGLHFPAHQGNHCRFVQAKLRFNRFKRGAVFPRHFNDAGNIGGT